MNRIDRATTSLECHNTPPVGAQRDSMRARLHERDAMLWTDEAAETGAIRNRLGWLDASRFSRAHLDEITNFSRAVAGDGFRHVVLLGMGGSSLAPEVLAGCFGTQPGGPDLTVLDSTSPGAVREVARRCPPAHSLYLVSSKSGTTAETLAFHDYFRSLVRQQSPGPAGRHFAAITDPGSPLEELARVNDFRGVFLNPADIGGRFSALSYFGLVPAATIGIDIEPLLDSADTVDLRNADADPAVDTGIILGELARQGRNKMTLLTTPTLSPLGAWIEQLVAESSGKNGRGIVPVDGEDSRPPGEYGDDRVFVHIGLGTDEEPELSARVDALATRGHPVLRWRLSDLYGLGSEFMRWEVATAVAGAVLGVNPFDEPDVNASKARTRALLRDGPDRFGGETRPSGPGFAQALDALCEQVAAGDYVAVLAFLEPTPSITASLQALRAALARRTGAATCLCFGPRYLHSSGQLHKGGIDQGVFLMLTSDTMRDTDIPGAGHGFQQLIMAQAMGDLAVLRDRGRRVVHLHLDDAAEGSRHLAASMA